MGRTGDTTAAAPDPVIRRRLLIEGRVQGVGYRYFCARQARYLELAGRVRNLYDGRVEVVAEGPAGSVDQLVAWCWEGPDFARVRAIQTFEESPVGETPRVFRTD